MVVLSASDTSSIHKVLERYNANRVYVYKVHQLYSMFMKTIFLVSSFRLFILEQFFHFAFLLWKSCMINEMLDGRLTDLDQEDIIVYKR